MTESSAEAMHSILSATTIKPTSPLIPQSSPNTHSHIPTDNDSLPILKPPQLNNIHDLGDTVWLSEKDLKPYVKIFIKTKNEYYKAEFSDFSAKKQREIIDKIESSASDDLLASLDRCKRPVPVPAPSIIKLQTNSSKRSLDGFDSTYPDKRIAVITPPNSTPNNSTISNSANNASISNLLIPSPPAIESPMQQGPRQLNFPPIVNTPSSPFRYRGTSYQNNNNNNSFNANVRASGLDASHRLLENVYFGLEEANRSFRELQDHINALRQENNSLRQDNFNMQNQLKNMVEKGMVVGDEACLEVKKVDMVISRYLPAIQNAISDTLTRALSDLKNDLSK